MLLISYESEFISNLYIKYTIQVTARNFPKSYIKFKNMFYSTLETKIQWQINSLFP